jgi:hypothetical protein
MKILVIGGNRFVGKKVAYGLSKLANVAVLNRSGTGPDKVKVIKWDRNEPFNIENDYNVILDFCLFKPAQASTSCKLVETQPKIYIYKRVDHILKTQIVYPTMNKCVLVVDLDLVIMV